MGNAMRPIQQTIQIFMQRTMQQTLKIIGVWIAATLTSQSLFANEVVVSSYTMDDVISRSMEAEYQKQIRQQNKQLAQQTKQRQQQQRQQQQSARKVTTAPARRVAVAPQRRVAPPVHRPTVVPLRRPVPVARHAPPSHQPSSNLAPEAEELFRAASGGSVTLISRLISQGVNINASNKDRETALHMAAARGHYSALIYLVNNGANINARTVKNWIPLHHAVRFRHANIANYLIQHGSPAGARTSDGMSAVDMARITGDPRMLSVLRAR